MWTFLVLKIKRVAWSRPGSNWGPSACKADVITTTPQDRLWRGSAVCSAAHQYTLQLSCQLKLSTYLLSTYLLSTYLLPTYLLSIHIYIAPGHTAAQLLVTWHSHTVTQCSTGQAAGSQCLQLILCRCMLQFTMQCYMLFLLNRTFWHFMLMRL